jgi:hypothetical protein
MYEDLATMEYLHPAILLRTVRIALFATTYYLLSYEPVEIPWFGSIHPAERSDNLIAIEIAKRDPRGV